MFVITEKSNRGIRTSDMFTGGVSVLAQLLDVWSVSSRWRNDVFVLALSCPVTRVTLMPDPAFKAKGVKEATAEEKLPSDPVLVAASLHFCLRRCTWKWNLWLTHPGWPTSSLCLSANSNGRVLSRWRSFDLPDESLKAQSGQSCVEKSGFYKAPEMMSS